MYEAIKHVTDQIADEAFEAWIRGGDVDALVTKRCADFNVADWTSTVRQRLTTLINDNHLRARAWRAEE